MNSPESREFTQLRADTYEAESFLASGRMVSPVRGADYCYVCATGGHLRIERNVCHRCDHWLVNNPERD